MSDNEVSKFVDTFPFQMMTPPEREAYVKGIEAVANMFALSQNEIIDPRTAVGVLRVLAAKIRGAHIPVMICLLLMGVGCGSPVKFVKEGATPQDFKNAQYDCKVQADRSAGAIAYRQDPLAHLNYISQARQDMFECLERQGWKVSSSK